MKNSVSKLVIGMLITSFVMPEMVLARAKKRNVMFSKARQMHRQKIASSSAVKNNKPTMNPIVNNQVTINNKTNVSNTNTTKEYKIADDRIAKLKSLVADVNKAKENVVTMCGDISTNISKIKALSATSAVSSAMGMGLSAGALGTGMMKTKQEKEEQAEKDRLLQEELDKRARESIERQERIKEEQEKERQQIIEEPKIREEAKLEEEIKEQIEEKKDTEVKQITEQKQAVKEQEQTERKNETGVKEIAKQDQKEQTTGEKITQNNITVKPEGNKEDKKKELKTEDEIEMKEELKREQIVKNMQEKRKKMMEEEQKKRNDTYDKIFNSIETNISRDDLTESQKSLLYDTKELMESYKRSDRVYKLRQYQTDDYYATDITPDQIIYYDNQIEEARKKEEESLRIRLQQRSKNLGFQLYSPLLAPAKLGNIRTGLMVGATATSVISMGTSAGATMNSGKLYEKMEGCNNAIAELKKVNGILVAEVLNIEADLKSNDVTENPDYVKDAEQGNKTAKNIVKGCRKYETKDIKLIKNLMTASSVISGIGTATALTGAVTSGLANTGTGKLYSSELDLTANIMAGVTTGTSVTTTGLSATAAAKLGKRLMTQATECEKTFN